MNKMLAINTMSWRIKVGLTIIVILAVIRFIWIPLHTYSADKVRQVESLKLLAAKKIRLAQNRETIELIHGKVEEALKFVSTFFYQDYNDVQSLQLKLQQEIEEMAKLCEFKILSIDWLLPTKGEWLRAPIRLRCKALPNNFYKFMSLVENHSTFLSIDLIEVTGPPGLSKEKNVGMNVSMDISAYGLKPEVSN